MADVTEKYAKVAGLRTRYLETGSGAPTLLIHGAPLGSSAEDWSDIMPVLAAAGLRAIALDQPGYGFTDNPADYTVEYRQTFFLEFLSALGIERANLVGHSQAGGMVANIALTRPERAAKAIIVATGSMLPPMPDAVRAGGPAEGEGEFATDPSIDEIRELLAGHVSRTESLTTDRVARYCDLASGKNLDFLKARRASGVSGVAKPANGIPFWKQLDKFPIPVRFIYGAHDRNHTGERARRAKDLYPDIDMHLVQDAKHLIHWDQPDTFARLTTDFLSRS